MNAFLSWHPFIVLGRLTYGIFLTHAAVQLVDVATMRTSDYYSDFKMVHKCCSDSIGRTGRVKTSQGKETNPICEATLTVFHC